jgi:hypothetical protein
VVTEVGHDRSLTQCVIQGGLANLEPHGGFTHRQSFIDDVAGSLKLVSCDDGFAAAFPTSSLSRSKASPGALSDQIPLELSERIVATLQCRRVRLSTKL